MKLIAGLLVAVALLAGVGKCVQSSHSDELSQARGEAKAAREIAAARDADAALALEVARAARVRIAALEAARDSAVAVADEASANEQAALDALDALQLPDSAADLVYDLAANASIVESSLRHALHLEKRAHAATKFALDTTSTALRNLRDAAARLSAADLKLDKSSRRSLLSRLLPRPGVGNTTGVDLRGRLNNVTGLTFGWTF